MPHRSPVLPDLRPVTAAVGAALALLAGSAAAQPAQQLVITGQKDATRKAIAAQVASDRVISVISADDIGALPDKNVAEALARMPGLSVQRDQGEGRYVVVRGIGPDLNAVTINGTLVPAPEASRRGVALDTLPAGMVRAVEVSKTLTPEQDANSIGGTVAVRTLSAFDLPGQLVSATIGASHDEVTDFVSPSISGLLAYRLTPQLGLAFGVSVENRRFGSDNVETGGAWTNGRLSGVELRDYLPVRDRAALSLNLDWRPTTGQQFYLRGFASEFSDDEVRDRLTIGSIANSAATPGGTLAEGQVATVRAERRLRQRKYTQQIGSLVLGGEGRVDAWTVAGQVGFGRASESTPESINDARFRQNNVAGVSFTNTRVPQISGPASLFVPGSYALNGFTLQARESRDDEHNLKIDLTRAIMVGGGEVELKFGAKTSRREKTNDTDQWAYNSSNATSPNFWGSGPTTLAGFAGGEVAFPIGTNGTIGPGIDPALVRARLAPLPRNPARLARESAFNDYRMNEDIDAAYLQGSWDVSPGLNLLAGVRHERTKFAAAGSQITPAGVVQPLQRDRGHSHTLPGLHLRLDLDRQTKLRAAWWNSVVRANFSQLAPGVNLASATEATIGNPDLKPLRSANLDLGVERQLGADGALSLYVFSKDVKDFTYTTNLAGTGPWVAYTSAVSFANGDKAHARGVEVSYQHALRGLPGALGGLIVGANATFSDTAARVARFDRTANAVISRETKLPGASDTVANLMLGYERGPWSARLALNHKSAYLLELGGDILAPAQDRVVDRQRQIDLSLAWQASRSLQVVFEGLNLNDEKYYVYQGSREFNTQYEQYGRTLKVSLKMTLY